jgi:hypothetical protein
MKVYLMTIGLYILYLVSDTIQSLLLHCIGMKDPFKFKRKYAHTDICG